MKSRPQIYKRYSVHPERLVNYTLKDQGNRQVMKVLIWAKKRYVQAVSRISPENVNQ
jgi:hypothetical protein